jgi:hypothetical protein
MLVFNALPPLLWRRMERQRGPAPLHNSCHRSGKCLTFAEGEERSRWPWQAVCKLRHLGTFLFFHGSEKIEVENGKNISLDWTP